MGINQNKSIQLSVKQYHYLANEPQFLLQLNQILRIERIISESQEILIRQIKFANLLNQDNVQLWDKMVKIANFQKEQYAKQAYVMQKSLYFMEFIDLKTKKKLKKRVKDLSFKFHQFSFHAFYTKIDLSHPIERYYPVLRKFVQKQRKKVLFFDNDLNLQDDLWEEREQDKQSQRKIRMNEK